MLLLPLTLLIVYSYVPMAGVVIAFQDFIPARGMFGRQDWVGLQNFILLFKMPDFKRALFNTVFIALMKMVFGLIVPLTVSLLLNELGKQSVKRTVQTMIYLPHFLSWVILGGILVNILSPSHGIVNTLLKAVGLRPVFFLGDNRWFVFTVISSDQWKEFGWGTIIYLAAISGVDLGLYEAAIMDGATRLQRAWHVTIPGIRHIIILLAVLSLGRVLNAGFDQIFNLYSPIVYQSGDIIDTLVYRVGLIQARFGLSTAVGLFKSMVATTFISVSYFLAYRTTGYRVF